MKVNTAKLPIVLLVSLLSFSACSELKSNDCASCTKKGFAENEPDKTEALRLKNALKSPMAMAVKGPLVIAKGDARAPAGTGKVDSKEGYQIAFCMDYERAQDEYDIEDLFTNMEKSPYPESFKDFWTTPACLGGTKQSTKVPIIFNTATSVVRDQDYPEQIHDYFFEKYKSPSEANELWLKTINTTTSDGYTFLDYLQFNMDDYTTDASKKAVSNIVSYLCKNGGVYNKYKGKNSCQ